MYIVLHVNQNTDNQVCEVYPGFEKAKERALEIIESFFGLYLIDRNPLEQKDGSNVKWVFVNDFANYLGIHYRTLSSNSFGLMDPLKFQFPFRVSSGNAVGSTGPIGVGPTGPTGPTGHYGFVNSSDTSVTVPAPRYNPMDHSLPAGWTYSGKPVNMAYLVDFPLEIQPTYCLNDEKKKALITSRISKSPLFTTYVHGDGVFDQQSALKEIAKSSVVGLIIIQQECEWLDGTLSGQRDSQEESDSSSEESSEDD